MAEPNKIDRLKTLLKNELNQSRITDSGDNEFYSKQHRIKVVIDEVNKTAEVHEILLSNNINNFLHALGVGKISDIKTNTTLLATIDLTE